MTDRDRPWDTEPDRLAFEAEGLPCVMRRNPKFGTWCGYVGIPREHPLFGKSYNDTLNLPVSWFEGRKVHEGSSPMQLFGHILSGAKSPGDNCPIGLALQVHGGVNFAEDAPPDHEPDGHWWLGFDCGHSWDYAPNGESIDGMINAMVESMPEEVRPMMREIVNRDSRVYRDQQYVVSECQSLASQLNAIVAVIQKEKENGSPDDRRD